MTYTSQVQFKFDATWTPTYPTSSWTDDTLLPEEHCVITAPAGDLTTTQYFKLFEKFLLCVGMCPQSIHRGAMSLVFTDMRSDEDMREIAKEFDLKLSEDYSKELRKLKDEIYDLKAKLSRCQQPDNPNYTESEIEAMTAWQYKEWEGLIPGSPEAVEKGCKCPVMDNEEMPEERKWVNADCPIHGKVK